MSSDLISERGRAALKKNMASRHRHPARVLPILEILENAICPRCNHTNTEMKSPFGQPFAARSIIAMMPGRHLNSLSLFRSAS